MSAGKGDRPRPVDKDRYNTNYDRIDWRSKRSQSSSPDASRRNGK
jgi:hypothetical protein